MCRSASILLALMALQGCAAHWINDPSPTVKNLINDLRLQGYVCEAGMVDVSCRQQDAYPIKAPMLCSSSGGCVPQMGKMATSVYVIGQDDRGMPTIKHHVAISDEAPADQGKSRAATPQTAE